MTAWRKLTPCVFITQSIVEPPMLQAPRQCHGFDFGDTTSDGVKVVVKRTSLDEFGAVFTQLDAEAHHQPLDGGFLLEPVDLGVGDASHGNLLKSVNGHAVPMAKFAQRLRDLRPSRKLTQTRLAELLQVSPRVYGRWEMGDVTPHFDTIVRIAELLEVSLDDLAGRTESQAPPKVRNHELHRLYQKVDLLSDEDQKALLDSLVKRSRISRMMAE